jgi:hypothetical protein
MDPAHIRRSKQLLASYKWLFANDGCFKFFLSAGLLYVAINKIPNCFPPQELIDYLDRRFSIEGPACFPSK